MEQILALLIITCSLYFSVSTDADEEMRRLDTFNAVTIKGPFEVELIQGEEHAVRIESRSTSVLSDVITEVRNGRLYVEHRRNDYDYRKSRRVFLTITCRKLHELTAKGAYLIRNKDTIRSEKLIVETNGAGSIYLKVNVQTLDMCVRGAGNTEVSGKAAQQIVRQSGIGNYRAFQLKSDTADVSMDGIGNIEINVRKQMEVNSSGIGKVRYKGNPEILRAHASLLQKIRPAN